jgi:hypothetical protein
MMSLLALWERPIHAWSFWDFLVLVIVIAGCLGVTYIVLQVCEVTVPPWVWKIIFIVGAVILGVWAIRFMASM